MKSREKRKIRCELPQRSYSPYLLAAVPVLVLAAFQAYSPALRGPFVFDDFNLPYYKALFQGDASSWFGGVRPLLMASFWLNYVSSGRDTFSYHLFGLLFHIVNSALVGAIAYRLLQSSAVDSLRAQLAAGFAGALFLLHPVQTESVAYIASRSENLSGLFFFGALVVYLRRPAPEIGWLRSAAVLGLFGAALLTKEHTVVLPAILVAADLGWQGERSIVSAVRRNWRLYAPLSAAAAVAAGATWRIVSTSISAGFHIAGLGSPLAYLWTECRVYLTYLALLVFPVRQTVDYDIRWIQTPWHPATLVGITVMAALGWGAWHCRSRYPVAAFGILVFLATLAPSSSFIPLADPIAEHRLYLPMLGVSLVAAESLLRLVDRKRSFIAIAGIVLVLASIASYRRNFVWGSEAALWEDAIEKAPDKQRDYSHLVHGLVREHRCRPAISFLDKLQRRGKVDSTLLVHWSFALECVQDLDAAADKLEQAARLAPAPDKYLRLAVLRTRRQHIDQAVESLDRAIELNPGLEAAYALRGDLNWSRGDFDAAAGDYAHVLELNPANDAARRRFAELQRREPRVARSVSRGNRNQAQP